eukprot:gb/GECG01006501.1/.p1 GENE.gb/GECG01006501.1/~~gb/GECG01006501.1/.p1  ORF type:complete len:523 (+),score=73.62 gb/GECG01006501.1/:1-1569(+)
MAGRGVDATIPAWKQSGASNGEQPTGPGGLQDREPREETRPRERGRQRDRSRSRERDRSSRNGDRKRDDSRKRRERSEKSGSPSSGGKTRRKRSSNFDVPPNGWVPPEGWVPGMPCPPDYPPRNNLGGVDLANPVNSANAPNAPSQQTRHARRLYVGNLPDRVGEEQLRKYFEDVVNKSLTEPLPAGGSPVLSVYINKDRRFGFVEFATIELTTACMSLDGIDFDGTSVRVRRPNDYKPESLPEHIREKAAPLNLQALSDKLRLPGGGLSSQDIIATLPKIHVSNLPAELTEAELEELFQPFGEIAGVKIGRDMSGRSKGTALVQYRNTALHNDVVQNMNGLPVGTIPMEVKHATSQEEQEIIPTAGMGTTAGSGSRGAAAAAALLGPAAGVNPQPTGGGTQGASAAAALFGDASSTQPAPAERATRVLKLGNMITENDLASDEEYRDICEDIRGECARFGNLKNVIVPREGAGVGSAFLEYSTEQESAMARSQLNGRTFGGQVVTAEYYDENKFNAGDYSA